jgi:hypothetical protein
MVYATKQQNGNLSIPTPDEFIKGYESFRRHEARDAMYKVATFLMSHFWGKYREMADALGVLLLTWNQACYRYGSFSFDKLEKCLKNNWQTIEGFRVREIFSLSESDKDDIVKLFEEFLEALKIAEGKSKGEKSPVAVTKALHLLAPGFFPLWDDKIARAYKCHYAKNAVDKYFLFCDKMRTFAEAVRDYNNIPKDVTILKLIDEYNYAKYTKKWI